MSETYYHGSPSEKALTAGKIPQDWLQNAAANESQNDTIEDWIAKHTRSTVVIMETGEVWVEAYKSWLSQDQIDEICRMIACGEW